MIAGFSHRKSSNQELHKGSLMKIIWKNIAEFEGSYQISNLGEVRSLDRTIYVTRKNKIEKHELKGRILKISTDKYGYKYVMLNKNNKGYLRKIHRLVAINFLEKNNSKNIEVNHIDGNKQNNSIENLEWVTRLENIQHSIAIGIRTPGEYWKLRSLAI